MNRLLFISLLAFAACNNSTNNAGTQNPNQLPATLINNPHTAAGMDTVAAGMKPVMTFKDTLHDFGTIHEDEVVLYEFAFSNTGKSPLIISSAAGSCGCTIPDYPHDPLAPGQSAVIKVSFNSAGKSGHQEKTVAIHTNSLRGIQMLYIKADVVKKQG
jgi:hypothetical protein